ncbi:MAG: cytochrome d ubiquinol oxidase subunit II [Pseudomonadota bacterium]
MDLFGEPTEWLPVVFAGLMGVSILIYVVLDGFDLGVGTLIPLADDQEKDRMVASIGPFWDANETWLVLAIGLLLVAFPVAHGTILTALYLPVAIMLIGLIARGVAFEFRAKAPASHKARWNQIFFVGSLTTALSQGFMLGFYIMGLQATAAAFAFSILTAICLTAGYILVGSSWLIIKAEGPLQEKAVKWARASLIGTALGFAAISIATPAVSPRIFDKWFSIPEVLLLAPLPIMAALIGGIIFIALRYLPTKDDSWNFVPFIGAAVLNVLAFAGLAYSFYPYIVPEKLTIYEAASAPESLFIILIGTVFVLPVIMGYTALAYIVFRGKARDLSYD